MYRDFKYTFDVILYICFEFLLVFYIYEKIRLKWKYNKRGEYIYFYIYIKE